MCSNRFRLSTDFTRQYLLTWYNRRPLIDRCIENLENGNAVIVNCPDEDREYTETNKCRIYFRRDVDFLLDIEFV